MQLPPGTWDYVWISVDSKGHAMAFDPGAYKVYRFTGGRWVHLPDTAFPPTGQPSDSVSRAQLTAASHIEVKVTKTVILADA